MKTESQNDLKRRLINALKNDLPVLRARVGLSQEVLADKIGISRQTYSSIETGKREMAWTTFLALVAFFQNNEQTLPLQLRRAAVKWGFLKLVPCVQNILFQIRNILFLPQIGNQ